MNNNQKTVSLFIPCLVEQIYPEIGLSMANVLRHFGYNLFFDKRQTCCGQPAFNAGHNSEARKVAGNFVSVFKNADVIIGPSGSCTAMVRNFYPRLFMGKKQEADSVKIGRHIFEFSEFLAKENLIEKISGTFQGKVGFHNSCHSYRELGITDQPFKILKKIKGIKLVQPQGEPVCCGFGGLFSFKFDAIAATMAKTRIEMFTSLGTETIVSNDPGCIMHMRQEAKDRKIDIQILHLAEFLDVSITQNKTAELANV